MSLKNVKRTCLIQLKSLLNLGCLGNNFRNHNTLKEMLIWRGTVLMSNLKWWWEEVMSKLDKTVINRKINFRQYSKKAIIKMEGVDQLIIPTSTCQSIETINSKSKILPKATEMIRKIHKLSEVHWKLLAVRLAFSNMRQQFCNHNYNRFNHHIREFMEYRFQINHTFNDMEMPLF